MTEFWVCENCKQIYWEGASFLNAKKRFRRFVDRHMGGEGGGDDSDECEDGPEEGRKKDSKLSNKLPIPSKL